MSEDVEKTLVYIRESRIGEAEMCVKTDGSFIAVPITQRQLVTKESQAFAKSCS